ncbi:hypothetical protein PAXRUDRAFT_18897 [Paxillus rubicundulus Ve08.2h10]|uniref:Unplaced genomic scaffold scaffold_3206, whole genome shotgun sequence n=1 Tax=Paxillus rubicundulus Ve08.2h10 TaxID=930991 RepID=A0A0D0D636_9AGAM|nr:hypothetical protein PAXRUDRAFT_18897 [Paxillus rubicundulus Ve08.2h10]
MVGRAKFQAKRKQVLSEHQEEALSDAINTYQEQQQRSEEDRRTNEELGHDERRKQRGERADMMAMWKEAGAAQLEHNRVQIQVHKEALVAWEVEKDLAKVERCRPGWNHPKLGKLESPLPKPMFESVQGVEMDGNEDNDGMGSDGGGSTEED